MHLLSVRRVGRVDSDPIVAAASHYHRETLPLSLKIGPPRLFDLFILLDLLFLSLLERIFDSRSQVGWLNLGVAVGLPPLRL